MTSKEIKAQIRAREEQREATARRLQELSASRDALALAGTPKERAEVRKAITAASADLQDDDTALAQLNEQHAQAQEVERVAGLAATTAHARREAMRGMELAERLTALAVEFVEGFDELAAIDANVRLANATARELNEAKIQSPMGGFKPGIKLFRTPQDERRVMQRAKQLRSGEVAAA